MLETLKNIAKFIWGLWGGFVFLVSIVVIFPFYYLAFYMFGKSAKRGIIIFSYKIVCRFILMMSLIRIKTEGANYLDENESYIIVSNHQSQMDILANAVSAPMPYQFLAKKEADRLPIFGYIIHNICILVDRKDQESRKASYQEMSQALEEGFSVLLYPEGTRNRTENYLKDFYDGAFKLAVETGKPIAVQTLVNSGNLSHPFSVINLCPGTIYCYWDKPIETKGLNKEDIPQLKAQVREIMLQHLAGEQVSYLV